MEKFATNLAKILLGQIVSGISSKCQTAEIQTVLVQTVANVISRKDASKS